MTYVSPTRSYPRILPFPYKTPLSLLIFCPARTRSDVFLLSSCANVAIIVKRSSPSPSIVQILSSTKYTSTPIFFNSRVVTSVSTVFLAKRQTSLVTIRSNCPFFASSNIFKNAGRFLACVPVIPSSIYFRKTFQFG